MEAFLVDAFLEDMRPDIGLVIFQIKPEFLLGLIVQPNAHFGGAHVFLNRWRSTSIS